MKRFLLITLSLLFVSMTFAQTLTPDEALTNALARIKTGTSVSRKCKAARSARSTFKLSYVENGTKQTPLYYVYNMTGGGFVIASADSRAHSLLGYTDEGSFCDMKSSPAFQDWLAECTDAMEWVSNLPESSSCAKRNEAETLPISVEPLLGDIRWYQLSPYNDLCPIRTENGTTAHALTGCVATATAQIMAYYKYPSTGEGEHTNAEDSTQTVDFSKSVYEWDKMKPTYSQDEKGDSAMAVAKLMYDIGCSVNMRYSLTFSGTYVWSSMYALTNYFGYDKGAHFEARSFYTSEGWNELLRNELDNRRPVIMGANSNAQGGHAFVIDGYDVNGLYHVNWGWNGAHNGYFDIDFMNPDVQGAGGDPYANFNIGQNVIVNIKPDDKGTSVPNTALIDCSAIEYDKENGTFSFTFENIGLLDFNGYAGFCIFDSEGNVFTSSQTSFENAPVEYMTTQKITYAIPDGVTIGEDFKIAPYFTLPGNDKKLLFPSPLTSEKYLTSYRDDNGNILWDAKPGENTPSLECSQIQILRNYVGYPPKLRVTVTNSSQSEVEYNDYISIAVEKLFDDDNAINICKGKAQCFLYPGETKAIDIECSNDMTEGISYKNMTEGTYILIPMYVYGNKTHTFNDSDNNIIYGRMEMVNTEASNVTYSDMVLNKSEIHQGELLIGSMKVTNTGGFGLYKYKLYIYPEEVGDPLTSFNLYSTDIAGYGETTVTLGGTLCLNPGKYRAFFYETSHDLYLNDDPIWLTVLSDDETAVDGVKEENAETKSATLFDVCGRRVKDMKHGGIYIVGGKKVVK